MTKRDPVPAGGIEVFDQRPITLDGFTLRARSAVAVGRPTIRQWQAALSFASAAHEAAPYWIGDLLNYAEDRQDWQEKLDQAKTATNLAHKTLLNLAYVAKHVAPDARELSPSVSHTAEVASLTSKDQRKYLSKATDEGWSRSDLRKHIKAGKRAAIIDGQAALEGLYRVIYADPPWRYQQNNPTKDGSLRKATEHYGDLSIDELCKLPVAAHATPDAVLFLWVTTPMLLQNPGPRDVLEAWGFEYKSSITWNKVRGMPGSYGLQVVHETLVIATRGTCLPDVPSPHDASVQTIRREGEHSSKPEDFRQLIEKHWTRGPYLELFGRKNVKGWTVFGNDARLWDQEVAS